MVGSGTIHRPPYLLALTGLDEPFEGRHFDRGIMVLYVSWYVRPKTGARALARPTGHAAVKSGRRFALKSAIKDVTFQ
jgi:hypothetical protein